MKNYIIASLFLVLIFNISCVKQEQQQQPKQTYTSKYVLDFNDSPTLMTRYHYQWMRNIAYEPSSKQASFTIGTRTVLASRWSLKSAHFGVDHLRVGYDQRILLPIHGEKNGKVSFECRGKNIDTCSLIVEGISRREQVVFSKIIKFSPDTLLTDGFENIPFSPVPKGTPPLTTVSIDIPLTDVELLNINIFAKGAKNKDADIILCKLDIFIGNQHIDTFPLRELPPIAQNIADSIVVIDLDKNSGFNKIEELKKSKIIGLGESIHGSGIVSEFACKLIMQQVEEENCKVVIVERTFEDILPYNRYILNEDFVLNKEYIEYAEELYIMSLVDNLKRYNSNKTLKDKVQLFGMDYNYTVNASVNTLYDIFDYVTYLNNTIKSDIIDQFALVLTQGWPNTISFLRENKGEMKKLFPNGEYESIVHLVGISRDVGSDPVYRILNRDAVMFVNTEFIINRFSPKGTKVVVYAHSSHINPISNMNADIPFGGFMKSAYSDGYLPLSILVGEGYNMARKEIDQLPVNTKGRLSTPPIGSMEYLLNSLGEDLLYLPTTRDLDSLVLSRSKGISHSSSEFFPFNLYRHYNGVFFIKNIETSSEQKKDMTRDNFFKRFRRKDERRKKIVKEIQERMTIFIK